MRKLTAISAKDTASHRIDELKHSATPLSLIDMSGDELGTLIIVILKARNLIDKHSFYKQDVYAQLIINGQSFNN